MCFFTGIFQGNLNFLETPYIAASNGYDEIQQLTILKTRDMLVIKPFKYDANKLQNGKK